jgi:hypothetical protein
VASQDKKMPDDTASGTVAAPPSSNRSIDSGKVDEAIFDQYGHYVPPNLQKAGALQLY